MSRESLSRTSIRTMQDAIAVHHDLGPSWWDCLDRPSLADSPAIPCLTRHGATDGQLRIPPCRVSGHLTKLLRLFASQQNPTLAQLWRGSMEPMTTRDPSALLEDTLLTSTDDQPGVDFRKAIGSHQMRVPASDGALACGKPCRPLPALRSPSREVHQSHGHRGADCEQDQARSRACGLTPGTTFRNPRAAIRPGTKSIQPGCPRRCACRNVKSPFVFTLPGLQRRGVT